MYILTFKTMPFQMIFPNNPSGLPAASRLLLQKECHGFMI